ncbi:hypothetical protein [Actinoallomurus iriomotensis]|uniref:Uncharacterized protein n=1 Tax=Actinoallomurus iriomotensis TaxID=478107 RepID=A0A9W6VU47_9ACTN|nr:hypothetical protein [Actinoallomurus iriomotensis]GLY79192.1 hypothetical protein Airi01_074590 [Actinoallomurus iriomotensis]
MSENIFIVASIVSEKLADERPYLETHLIVCRECDYTTGTPLSEEQTVYARHNDHYDATGHNRFWKYTIGRSRGRIGRTVNDL